MERPAIRDEPAARRRRLDEQCCIICSLEVEENGVTLKCCKIGEMHSVCLARWLFGPSEMANSCPGCRAKILSVCGRSNVANQITNMSEESLLTCLDELGGLIVQVLTPKVLQEKDYHNAFKKVLNLLDLRISDYRFIAKKTRDFFSYFCELNYIEDTYLRAAFDLILSVWNESDFKLMITQETIIIFFRTWVRSSIDNNIGKDLYERNIQNIVRFLHSSSITQNVLIMEKHLLISYGLLSLKTEDVTTLLCNPLLYHRIMQDENFVQNTVIPLVIGRKYVKIDGKTCKIRDCEDYVRTRLFIETMPMSCESFWIGAFRSVKDERIIQFLVKRLEYESQQFDDEFDDDPVDILFIKVLQTCSARDVKWIYMLMYKNTSLNFTFVGSSPRIDWDQVDDFREYKIPVENFRILLELYHANHEEYVTSEYRDFEDELCLFKYAFFTYGRDFVEQYCLDRLFKRAHIGRSDLNKKYFDGYILESIPQRLEELRDVIKVKENRILKLEPLLYKLKDIDKEFTEIGALLNTEDGARVKLESYRKEILSLNQSVEKLETDYEYLSDLFNKL